MLAAQRLPGRHDGRRQDHRGAPDRAPAEAPFFDSDHEIERRCGVKIPVIFDIEGEAGFRQREAAVIAELAGARGRGAGHRRRRGAAPRATGGCSRRAAR